MKTNCLCDAPTPRAFAAAEGRTASLTGQILLTPDELWHSSDRHSGVTIQILDGLVWITVEGDPHDHVLHKGESFRSLGHERVVAQSLGTQARMFVKQ